MAKKIPTNTSKSLYTPESPLTEGQKKLKAAMASPAVSAGKSKKVQKSKPLFQVTKKGKL